MSKFICWFISIDWTPEAVTAASTIALAFLTLVLAVRTLFLWLATRRLVRGAEETAKTQLRAYVFVKGGGIDITPDGIGFVAHIIFKNFGQTPAYQYSTWLGGGIFPIDDLPFPSETKPLSERVNRSIVWTIR